MAGQVSPGIVLRERDLTASTIVNSQANTAAFVGSFAKGPVGVITNITTEKELLDTFGAPNNNNYEDWFVASTFLSYGGQLNVVRVNDTTLKNAVTENGSQVTDATKLYVVDANSFTIGDVVKVDNEYFAVTATSTVGAENLTVTRAQLGSSAANHANGATVTKWSYTNSATTTVVNETIDASETIIDLTSATGFTVGSYFRLTNSGAGSNGADEIVLITAVEGNQVIITRAQLGTSALAQPGATITATLLTFAVTATTTTLSEVYPRVTTTGIASPTIKSLQNYEANYSGYTWKFASRTPGTWSNNVRVAWIDGSVASYDTQTITGTSITWSSLVGQPASPTTGSSTSDDLHIVVLDTENNIVESFLYLSRTSTAKNTEGGSRYYVDVLKNKSGYIYTGTGTLAASGSLQMSGGVDAYTTTVSTINTSFDLFADAEEIQVDFVLTGGSLSIEADQVTKAQKAISIAANRKDCVAFVSPHNGFVGLSSTSAQRDDIITFFNSVGTSTSYAVLDSGYKYVYDRFADTYRYIPCCGDVAGLCVQTSATLEDWYSPAGTQRGNIRNAVKLAYTPTKTDRDKLYQKRINPITSFPGQGVVLFGDKTALSTPSAFDRINVRRLFLAIEKRVNQLAKNVLFELNDSQTRGQFFNAVNSYMSEVKAKRGVIDFLVVCDESNNTPDVIDRNEFVAEVYVQPTRSINYITITFVATRTGVTFSEVVGR